MSEVPKITTDAITISRDHEGSFTVRMGDRWADQLTYDEMLGTVARLTMPGSTPFGGYLKTQREHDALRDLLKQMRRSLEDQLTRMRKSRGVA